MLLCQRSRQRLHGRSAAAAQLHAFFSAKLPTILTDLDRKVQAVTDLDALEIIGKVVYNAAVSPAEPKYRKLRLANPTIQASIVAAPGALDLLLALGWVRDEADDTLVIPAGVEWLHPDCIRQAHATAVCTGCQHLL
jgi:hypothetical protein